MNFPFAMVNNIAFIIYIFYFGIWATSWLELVVYLPLNFVSWWRWSKHKDEDNELLAKSKKLSALQNILVTAIIIGMTVLVHFTLSELAGDSWMKFALKFGWSMTIMQWLDSAIFSIGVVSSFLQMLREEEETADIPVIFLTGVGTKEAVQRVMALKPDGYVLKSTTRDELLSYLKSKLG
ncbi:MAG: nicotinamide mononucleotide transporter [Lachnospiraceae bacterium]|nr:nicotinamide mononucleotide transporter [Lachnospiraceae bacterium]